jgi:DNA-binding response OmpR family regulator
MVPVYLSLGGPMNHSNFQIVLIDDDKDLLEIMKMNLQEEFKVESFSDANAALKFVEEYPIDAIVVDYHMPGKNAFELYMELRMKKFHQPFLLLTGDADLELKLNGLELGVEDFLHKPISTAELSAHLKNRIKSYKRRSPQIIKIKNLQINLNDTVVVLNGNQVTLTPKEFEILSMLMTNPNVIIKKSEVMAKLWPDTKVEENNIDTHLSNLRKKLTGFSCEIKTVKCIGFILRV